MPYAITLRSVKGSPLTHDEMDDNWREATQVVAKWNATRQYVSPELVAYNGVIYKALTTNTNKQPDINGVEWAIYVPTHSHTFADISAAVKDEDNMASNSAVHVPTQQSVKAYVDAQLGFTAEDAQDAVGTILTDTTSIDFTYNDGANTISAVVKDDGIVETMLSATNAPTAGYVLSYDAGGGFTWIAAGGGSMDWLIEATGTPTTAPAANGTGSLVYGEGGTYTDADYSVVFGYNSQIAGSATSAIIMGGESHQIDTSGTYASIFGGLNHHIYTGCDFSAIVGGEDNIVGTGTATHAGILGGDTNTISGSSVAGAIVGGKTNVVNNATGGVAIGGESNAVGSLHGVGMGLSSKTYLRAQFSHTSGVFSAAGDAQRSVVTARRSTTNNTTATLFIDGTSAELALPSDCTWGFIIQVTARQTGGASGTAGDSAVFFKTGAVKTVSGTASLVGTATETGYSDAAASAWTCALSVSGSNLQIRVTGETNKNIRRFASVQLAEVTS